MFAIKNFTDNDDVRVLGSMGPFTVVEYLKDLSVTPSTAMTAYYCNEMNVRKRQVICDLSKANITLQAGAMQWMAGNVNATTGLKGVGDFFGKAVRGKVTSINSSLGEGDSRQSTPFPTTPRLNSPSPPATAEEKFERMTAFCLSLESHAKNSPSSSTMLPFQSAKSISRIWR